MSVVKKGNQYCTAYCHGKDAGKVITCFDTKAEAEAQHRAISAGKYKKLEIDINKL